MKKVVIIGAGPAGLSAAYYLLKNSNDYSVTIIEEEEKVGGISKTVEYNNTRMDLGGHRFFSKSKVVNDLWKEILPEKEFMKRNRKSRIYYRKKFFDYPISLNFKTINNLGFITTFMSGISYIKSVFIKKKEDNLENFYINRFGNRLYTIFFKDYTKKVWGRDAKDISSDWGTQRVKGLDIIKVIKNAILSRFNFRKKEEETSLIDSFYYPKYGPGEMWEEMSKKIIKLGGEIITNSKVTNVHKTDNKIDYIEYQEKNKTLKLKGDIFISSMPIKDLLNSMNSVDKEILNISNNLPYRDFMTLGLVLKKTNIDLTDNWIYVQEKDITMGRIQVFNNWSSYLVEKGNVSLGLEYFCNEDDKLWNMDDSEFLEYATNELLNMGIINKEDIIDYHIERVKKAYPAYFDSYHKIDKVIDYLNKIDNIYCIGRNGQHRYNNMDHSMLTGIEASKNIINNAKEKDNIWNINTEKDYLEEQNV